MLYDLSSTPPESGSMLEPIFLLVSLRRREAELYQTEVLMNAIMLAGSDSDDYSMLDNSYREYKNAIFPFLEAERRRTDAETRKSLEYWSTQVFRVKPLWLSGENKRNKHRRDRGMEIARRAEALRSTKRHQRI